MSCHSRCLDRLTVFFSEAKTNNSSQMATESHEKLYKLTGQDISSIKFATKTAVKLDRKRQREKILLTKRLKVDNLDEAETSLSILEEEEKVAHETKLLKKGKKLEALKQLQKCFARNPSSAEIFIRLDGLQSLRGCFMLTDSEVLHAAVWCAINLSAGSSSMCGQVMQLSPLLIQYLQGSDRIMQELCAWTLGNLAGDTCKNRETLLKQGCLTSLVSLVSSKQDLIHKERLQSVLFALVNFARDKDYKYIRCMQENSIFNHIQTMLTDILATSDLCLEMGWLISCIYTRPETFVEFGSQCDVILHMVINKLSEFTQTEDFIHRGKIMFPFIYCLANMIGQHPSVAMVASQCSNFLCAMFTCLNSQSDFLRREALWLLNNFMAEPSCRVLVMSQTSFLSLIFRLCQAVDEEISLNALLIVESMSKVSRQMCEHIVEQGGLKTLKTLLTESHTVETVLDILTDLVWATDQAKVILQASDEVKDALQHLISTSKSDSVIDKAKNLSLLLGS